MQYQSRVLWEKKGRAVSSPPLGVELLYDECVPGEEGDKGNIVLPAHLVRGAYAPFAAACVSGEHFIPGGLLRQRGGKLPAEAAYIGLLR